MVLAGATESNSPKSLLFSSSFSVTASMTRSILGSEINESILQYLFGSCLCENCNNQKKSVVHILTNIEAFYCRRADLYTIEGRLDKIIRCTLVFFVRFFGDPLQALINSNVCGRDLTYCLPLHTFSKKQAKYVSFVQIVLILSP